MRRSLVLVLVLVFVIALVTLACGDDAATPSASPAATGSPSATRLTIITTVEPVTNIVANVVGQGVTVEGVIPPGVDSHTFEPTPDTARALARADVVFVNGLHLEQSVVEMAQSNNKAGAEIVLLGDRTVTPDQYVYDFSFPKEQGDPNPHLWMSPRHAQTYARIVADTMSARDPANRDLYQGNLNAFGTKVDALDTAIKAAVATVPEKNRKLITYHDSFAYFAPVYGFTVLGAVQPADFSEPSPQEVARLIDQVKKEQVPAIFGSEVFPSPVLEQIAREAGAKYIDKLRDDELPGAAGSPQHTYIGMMVEDVTLIVEALGGDASAVKTIDATNVGGSGGSTQPAPTKGGS